MQYLFGIRARNAGCATRDARTAALRCDPACLRLLYTLCLSPTAARHFSGETKYLISAQHVVECLDGMNAAIAYNRS